MPVKSRDAVLRYNALEAPTEQDAIDVNKVLYPTGKPEKMTDSEWQARHRWYSLDSGTDAPKGYDADDAMWFLSASGTSFGLMMPEARYDEIAASAAEGCETAQRMKADIDRGIAVSSERHQENPFPGWPHLKENAK